MGAPHAAWKGWRLGTSVTLLISGVKIDNINLRQRACRTKHLPLVGRDDGFRPVMTGWAPFDLLKVRTYFPSREVRTGAPCTL